MVVYAKSLPFYIGKGRLRGKTKEGLEEVSYGRGTERRKDVEEVEEVGSDFVKVPCSYTGDNWN